jgi:hypothetical protein
MEGVHVEMARVYREREKRLTSWLALILTALS